MRCFGIIVTSMKDNIITFCHLYLFCLYARVNDTNILTNAHNGELARLFCFYALK